MIIFKLKNQLSGIINEIEINIPEDLDQEIIQRIKSSLLIINIPNSFTEIDEETYLNKPRAEHYSKEDYIITKIMDGEEEYQRFKREIERAKQINPNDSRLLEITDYNAFYTKEKYQQWKMKLTCKEREALKLHHLDNNYCLFLTSMWFNDINDFKNIEIATKRAQNNTHKFMYNPVPLDENTRYLLVVYNTRQKSKSHSPPL